MLAWLTEYSIRVKSVVAIVWIFLILGGLFGANDLNSRLTTSLTIPNSESAKAEELLGTAFGENSEGLISITYRFGTITEEEIKLLKVRITNAASVIPNSTLTQQSAIGGTLFTVLSTPLSLTQAAESIEPLRRALDKAGLTGAMVTGPPAIYQDVVPVLHGDLRLGQLIAGISAILFLIAILGFSFAIFLPFIFALATISLTLGILDLLSMQFLMVLYIPSVVELIGFGLAVDYSLLIVHRFRSEVRSSPGISTSIQIRKTMETAGRTVLISSLTLACALATLLFVPIPFIRSLGMAGVLVPLTSALASVTLAPALLAIFSKKLTKSYGYVGLLERAEKESLFINRIARLITRAPKRVFFATLSVLALLALPLLSLQVTPSSLTALPSELESAKALSYVTTRVGEGMITPIVVMAKLKDGFTADDQAVANARLELADKLSQSAGVSTVAQGSLAPYRDTTGKTLRIFVFSTAGLGDPVTSDLVKRIRSQLLPDSNLANFADFYVGGSPAQGVDLLDAVKKSLPFIFIAVLLAIYLILARTLKSVILPIKAIALDAISIAASLGLLVAFMKFGIAKELFGAFQLDQIEIWALVFLIAILFGLSMDYEIFIVSRMREAWLKTGDNSQAVVAGFTQTVSVVTAAAAIFIAAVSGLAFGHFAGLQELGIGLAIAVLIDATLIRGLLLPSAMILLGKWNWWSPKKFPRT
jgi:RND superfamily putative drug exporter